MNKQYSEYPFPPSLWGATALPFSEIQTLNQDIDTDVVVIGAGMAGLSTALHLAEKNVSCVVIEANQIGWGASGRNGGQVIPGLKYDPDEIEQRMGAKAQAVIEMAGAAADYTFDLIKKYKIDCYPKQSGWIQTAHKHSLLKVAEKRAKQWEARGAKIELLDKEQITNRIGAKGFVGGWVDYRAGSVHPLRYTQGLANACRDLGVKIFENTKAVSINKDNNWIVKTGNGSLVIAKNVVIATNGYSDDLWPKLKKTIMPANSFVIATKPLDEKIRSSILKNDEVTSDSRRLLVYFRKDSEGRFILGGRGSLNEPHSNYQWDSVITAMTNLFPQLKNVEIDYRWAGRVAVTADFLVHVHEPSPNIHILVGFNGRGVALTTIMGAKLANRIANDDASSFPYPITEIKPIPLHQINKFYMALGVNWYKFLDKIL